jgi:hypothetical protein
MRNLEDFKPLEENNRNPSPDRQEGATPRRLPQPRSRLGAAFSCPVASAKPTWMTLLKILLRKGGVVSDAFR